MHVCFLIGWSQNRPLPSLVPSKPRVFSDWLVQHRPLCPPCLVFAWQAILDLSHILLQKQVLVFLQNRGKLKINSLVNNHRWASQLKKIAERALNNKKNKHKALPLLNTFKALAALKEFC